MSRVPEPPDKWPYTRIPAFQEIVGVPRIHIVNRARDECSRRRTRVQVRDPTFAARTKGRRFDRYLTWVTVDQDDRRAGPRWNRFRGV